MKKWLILGGIVLLVLIINAGFFYWTSQDAAEDELVVTDRGVVKQGWEKYIESNVVEFDTPMHFNKETSLTGLYWFEPDKQKVAIVFEKFSRDRAKSVNEQIAQNILNPAECAGQVEKAEFIIYQNCPYLNTSFTFAALEHRDQLGIISFDERFIDKDDINYVVNSLIKL